MSFLTWAALGIGLLVVAPLIAHLLRRRPPEEESFAATELVPPRTAVAQRRTAIEDRALFAVRALAVLALALLGATPFVQCSRLSLARPSGASVALAIVLDDSLSMRAGIEEEDASVTRFARAQAAAAELLEGMQEGDAVAIVLAGKPARVALAATTNIAAARGVLDKVSQSDRGSDLDGAVKVAGELLSDLQHVDKRVVVLSDLAQSGGPADALVAPQGVKLWVPLPELRGARDDCALVRADRSGARVKVLVACSPEVAERPERQVEIRAGDEVLASSRLWLDGDRAEVALTLPDGSAAARPETQLYAALTGADAIAADDTAPVVSLGGQLKVAMVSDEAETRVATGGPPPVEQAFQALDLGAQLQPLPAVPDRMDELESVGMLIVDDMPGFTPAQRRGLAEWVQKGGVLLITLGPHAAAAPIGMSFAPMIPGIVRWQSEAPKGIDLESDRVFGEASAGTDDLAPRGRAQLDLELADGHSDALRTLVAWQDGAPLMIEHRMGRGVAYVLTLPLSASSSDLPLRPGFLALLLRLTETARSLGGVARTPVGSVWSLDGFEEVAVTRTTAKDEQQPLSLGESASGAKRVVVELAGLYRLELDGTTAYRVAAVDETEVDLRPRDAGEEMTSSELGSVRATVDVSPYVAILLLALLFAELALRVLARKVPAPEAPASQRPAPQGPTSQGPTSQGPTSQGPTSQGPAREVPAGPGG